MEALFILLPLSLLLVGTACLLFLRAVTSGQMDDLEDHALDIFSDPRRDPHPRRPAAGSKPLNCGAPDEHCSQ